MQTQNQVQTSTSRTQSFSTLTMAPWRRPHKVALLIMNAGFVCYLVHLLQDQRQGRHDSLEVNPRSLNGNLILERLDRLDWNIYSLCK